MDFHRDAYLAKTFCAEQAMKIGTDGVQLSRRPRILPRTPGRDVVPKPAGHRPTGRRSQPVTPTRRSELMINLELSKAHAEIYNGLMQVSEHMIRPYSRKYDREEHSYPKRNGGSRQATRAMHAAAVVGRSKKEAGKSKSSRDKALGGHQRQAILAPSRAMEALCWGDVGLVPGYARQRPGQCCHQRRGYA